MAEVHMNRFLALDDEFMELADRQTTEKSKEAKPVASQATTTASAPVCPDEDVKCSRCGRVGHNAKDCKLPFAREFTRAEMRTIQEKKKAAWIRKQAEESANRKTVAIDDCDTKSDISLPSTAPSTVATLSYEETLEVSSLVAKDKEVRRLEKLCREIAKLEQRTDLDALQLQQIKLQWMLTRSTPLSCCAIYPTSTLERC